jgi:type IV secretion system protein VirB4
VLAFLDPPSEDNIAARLQRWIHSEAGEGQLSWVFDNAEDELDFTQSRLFGLDMTYFLDDDEIRTPILMYLFHRINQIKDGRRGAVIIDEGWKALDDEEFAATMGDSLKTDRKKDWLLGVITQSPADSLKSKIAHTISEQVATKMYLPNLRARKTDYVDGLGCTEGVFETIRTLSESGRRFVVQQGDNAVVCELDLGPLEDDLAVFSGTAANVALLDQIRARVGDDPDVWLPIYHQERKRA